MKLNTTAIRFPENLCQVQLSPSHAEEWHLLENQQQSRHVVQKQTREDMSSVGRADENINIACRVCNSYIF